ncbi:ATP-binding protein [Victivallis vadensis]|uniref:ATP-binding protein n=1 Tax=Victivallis vadensis TaxID=172901 RepID=A0A848B0K1_9BACT|nr:AAA family ATPase [Victivallis vadensis]NMD89385.1 ATP-binding protein [Victivallis vadensis]
MTIKSTDLHPHNLSFDAYKAGLENYSKAEAEQVEWLWGYFNGPLGKDKAALCKEFGMEWEQLRPLFSGRVAASIRAETFEAITALRRRLAKSKPLVRTIVTERIIQALDYCRDYSAMVYVTGPTGRGKTYTAEWWAGENNHGRTKYIRVPSDCTRRALVQELCKVAGCATCGTCAEMEGNLRRAIGPRNIIIADEAGHLLSRSGRPGGAIELLRDLHDMTGCGVALIFTDVYLAEIKRGRNADYFEQFLGRLEFPVEIPQKPRRDEVRQVLTAFFADGVSEELVSYALGVATARDGKLRTLFKDLFRAEELAKNDGRKITADDFKLFVKWRKSAGAWPEDR